MQQSPSEAISSGAPSGVVYLVGAGPGDAGLLTLRAADLLAKCDVLVYDALVSLEILALCAPEAERVYVGKRGGQHTLNQSEINELLVQKALAGKRVVRLKGGDPYLFGRGAEEAIYLLEHGAAVEVVPGVTAGIAAAAYAGIPVTHREHASAVAFVTGHEDPDKPESALDWEALSKVGTLCFYMGVKNLGRITSSLARYLRKETPVAVIEWGTTARQRTIAGTLEDIEARCRAEQAKAPALTVVGEVVALREQLNFFERRPLFGRRIVVTRSRTQASDVAFFLGELGAEVLLFPTIRIVPPEDGTAFQEGVAGISSCDWVVLTSVNGVDALFEELRRQGKDARALGNTRVVAIGSATARQMEQYGVRADLIPPKYVAESIIESLRERGVFKATAGKQAHGQGSRFLFPRADLARSDLPEQLRALGCAVTEVDAYRTVLETEGQEEAIQALVEGRVHGITFSSSSTVRNFVDIIGPARLESILTAGTLKCLSIGPITSSTMKELGIPVDGEAQPHDIPGLVELIKNTFSRKA